MPLVQLREMIGGLAPVPAFNVIQVEHAEELAGWCAYRRNDDGLFHVRVSKGSVGRSSRETLLGPSRC